ncbi:MAG: hypothetical protein Q9174_000291 [Haloplaca sp. 1 TL-2023]
MLAAQADLAASAAEQPTAGPTAGQENQHLLSLQRKSDKDRQQISSWNTAAHLTLRDDDTYEEGLEDINEGQSHRARLLATMPQQSSAASNTHRDTVRGGRGGRPRAGRGGRGGGAAGARPARSDQSRLSKSESPGRVILPSITGRPAVPVPERLPMPVRRPEAAPHAATLAPPTAAVPANRGNRIRTQTSRVSLALPNEFFSHAFATVNRGETSTSQASASSLPRQAPPTTGGVQVSYKVPVSETSKAPTTHSSTVDPPASTVTKTQTLEGVEHVKEPAAASDPNVFDRVSHEPRMGTLLEADSAPGNSTATPATNAYMDELMGLEFARPSLEAFQSSLESTLSILRQSLPSKNPASTALMGNIEAHFLDVQRELSRWSIHGQETSAPAQAAEEAEQGRPPRKGKTVLPGPLQPTPSEVPLASEQVDSKAATEKRAEPRKHSASAFETKGHHQALLSKAQSASLTTKGEQEVVSPKPANSILGPERGKQLRPVSLADTVQQRATESFQQFTGGRIPIERPLFGEYVHRSRFLQHHDSVESVDSGMSTSEVSTFPDRMQGVVSTHTPIPEAVNSTSLGEGLSRTAFQSTNDSGHGPTTNIESPLREDAKSATHSYRLSRASETQFSQPSSRPQLPAFLVGAARSDDPGAAARAQYSGGATAAPATLATSSRSSIDTVRKEAAGFGLQDTNSAATPYGRSSAGPSSNENTRPLSRTPNADDPNPRFSTPGNYAAPISSAPRLPAFLAGTKPAKDPGAAAREQYERNP